MRTAIVLALSCTIVQPAVAWGRDGHRLIALLAEHRLSPAARAGLRELLGDERISDPSVCSWADQIRRNARDTGPWHYVSGPLDSPLVPALACPDDDCAPAQITLELQAISDPARALSDRREALRLLVHFVADLHQPLHAAARPDHGGNAIRVGSAGSLHSTFDELFVTRLLNGRPVEAFAAVLEEELARSPHTTGPWLADLSPWAWAQESHRLARTVYTRLGLEPGPGSIELSGALVSGGSAMARVQLQKAGLRLAAVLEEAFETYSARSGR